MCFLEPFVTQEVDFLKQFPWEVKLRKHDQRYNICVFFKQMVS